MTIRNDIIELLIRNKLTITEISEKLEISKNNISSYLDALKKVGRIEAVDNSRKPHIYRAITPKALLYRLYNFMSKMNLGSYIPNDDETQLVKQVKELIK